MAPTHRTLSLKHQRQFKEQRFPSELWMAHLPQSFGLSPSHSAFFPLFVSLTVCEHRLLSLPRGCSDSQRWKEPAGPGAMSEPAQRHNVLPKGSCGCWHRGLLESQVHVPKTSWQTSCLTTGFDSWISLVKLGISPSTSAHRQCPHCLKGSQSTCQACTCSKQLCLKVKPYQVKDHVPCL